MSGQNLYYDLVTILRNAGCVVKENGTTNGWQRRARSSGGFPVPPLGVWWHHTASKTSPESDLNWMINGSSDAPIGNILIDRTGACWPIAGGASNTAGKGGPASFSRGTVAADSGNTGGFQIEVANNGVGEAWPQAQIDAFFRASNALNAAVGNQPSDVITHERWAPTRKIDPATAAAVQGPWKPRSTNGSGTWNLQDIINECIARFSGTGDDDLSAEQFQQIMDRLTYISQQCDNIAYNIYGGPADNPPYSASVWGRIDEAVRVANAVYGNTQVTNSNIFGGPDNNPPVQLAMLNRLDTIQRKLGIDPWAGIET